nr:uncharacterized protein LOC132773385 [Anolis sagrei ordinatus]
MMGFSGLPLRCFMLTGLFIYGETHSSPASASPYLTENAGGSSEEVVLTQGMSLRITAFCAYQYLPGDKMWCKETEQKECDLNKSFSLSGWKLLSTRPNQKITLEGPRNGCLSLFMTALEVEDSGTYWFGLIDGLKMISLKKIKVVVHENPLVPTMIFSPPTSTTPSFGSPNKLGRRLQEVIKEQGESLIMKAFCSQQHQAKKVWCKGDILKECNLDKPVGISGTGWQYLTPEPNQRVVLLESGNGCIYFFISALHMEDSGIYWFGILEDLNIIPLRKFKVIVQKA